MLEGGEGLGEQVGAVGEGAALGHEEAGAGAGARGGRPAAVAPGVSAASSPAVAGEEGAEDGGVRVVRGFGRPVHQGLPPAPTRVMISQSARSSKTREVGIRTVVLRLPVTGWPARLIQ